MTTQEFSNAFDTLLNSYKDIKQFGKVNSNFSIELDEYEKSILLTQAQDIVVKSYFDRNLNNQAQGFDDTSRRQIDFSELITVASGTKYTATGIVKFDDRGVLYSIPKNVLFILNEQIKTSSNLICTVIPINFNEYDRVMSKAFSQPLKKQCWRLLSSSDDKSIDTLSELITGQGVTISDYKIRYIRRPCPIVLTDLSTGSGVNDKLNIDGVSVETQCELNPIIHVDILNKGIELALLRIGAISPDQQQQEGDRQ